MTRVVTVLGLLLAVPGVTSAQELALVVAQFYPARLIDVADPLPHQQCYAVADTDTTGRPTTVVAAYTDSYFGAVRVLRRTAAGFEVAAEPAGELQMGLDCRVEIIDLDGDGRKEVHVAFIGNNGTSDWFYSWDGQQLVGLTPTEEEDLDPSLGVTSDVVNASVVDVDGDGILEIYSFQKRIGDAPPPPSLLYRLNGNRLVLDTPVVTLFSFERAEGSPKTSAVSFFLPKGATGPFMLRIVNGAGGIGRVENAVESARVWLNGVQVAAPSDFGTHAASIERPVDLQDDNRIDVRLAGAPGGRIEILILASNWTSR